ncbi:MAG: hypothetical protein O7B23_10760 [Deltaproteobacteria bacterium]|nr:hypothetical protein [Deltaproteobacteria bacterium]
MLGSGVALPTEQTFMVGDSPREERATRKKRGKEKRARAAFKKSVQSNFPLGDAAQQRLDENTAGVIPEEEGEEAETAGGGLDTAGGTPLTPGQQAKIDAFEKRFSGDPASLGPRTQATGVARAPTAEEAGGETWAALAETSKLQAEKATAEAATAVDRKHVAQRVEVEHLARSEEIKADAEADKATRIGKQIKELNEVRAIGKDDLDARREDIDRVLHQVEADINVYANTTIAKRESTSQKIFNTIAIALGSMGSGSRGQGGGRNAAAEIIMASLDRDLKIQQMELNRKGKVIGFRRNLLGDMRGVFGDEVNAQAATRLGIMESYKLAAEQAVATTNSLTGRQNVKGLVLQLDTAIAKERSGIAERMRSETVKKSNDIEKSHLGTRAAARSKVATLKMQVAQARLNNQAAARTADAKRVQQEMEPTLDPETWFKKFAQLRDAPQIADNFLAAVKAGEVGGFWADPFPTAWKNKQQRVLQGMAHGLVVAIVIAEQGRASNEDIEQRTKDLMSGWLDSAGSAEGAAQSLKLVITGLVAQSAAGNPRMARKIFGDEQYQTAILEDEARRLGIPLETLGDAP